MVPSAPHSVRLLPKASRTPEGPARSSGAPGPLSGHSPNTAPFPAGPLPVEYASGQTVAQAVYLSGLFRPPALCSAISRCGRCRMRFIAKSAPLPDPVPEDRRSFSPRELEQGWRLGCRHFPVDGLVVELPESVELWQKPLPQAASPFERAPAQELRTDGELAVDLGTTSLQWELRLPEDASAPRLAGYSVNPQMGAGSEVISRLAVAATPGGASRLRELARSALLRLVQQGENDSGVRAAHICLAANPAMTALALGWDTAPLAHAPYSLPRTGGSWATLPDLPPLWVPPQLSPFVGGDISAGYAALALDPAQSPPAYPFLLADLGTNGEFLLALAPLAPETPPAVPGSPPILALVASVALGPALEGIGLTFGTEAREGAVTGFSLTPQGLQPRFFLPDGADLPRNTGITGITGTGYLSLLHCLQKAGAMDRDGHFTPEKSPLLRRFLTGAASPCACPRCAPQDTPAAAPQTPSSPAPHPPPLPDEPFLPLGHGLYLTSGDVEEILKVKAAFSLGLALLFREAGIASTDLAGVYLAGALGRHVDKEALENLGFFPPGMGSRLTAAGNTSLAGAGILLRHEKTRAALTNWATRVRAVDLAANPAFEREFPGHMRFAW